MLAPRSSGSSTLAQPDTLMSRATNNATHESERRADQTQFFAGAKDNSDRIQRRMWQEQARMLYGRSNATWATRGIGRTLFIFSVLAISTMAFYVFFGESREILSESRLIAHQERPVMAAGPARLIFAKQSGSAHERLPLGIIVEGGSGEETVTLKGFAT